MQGFSSDKTGATRASSSAPALYVGVGASAGGLAALEQLLAATPPDLGVAYIIVQHLSADRESSLAALLQRHSNIPVVEVTDQAVVQSNHAYVMFPGKFLRVIDGALRPVDPPEHRGSKMPIDYFFRSLAEDQRERACSIVLSGAGSDGALGIRAIKAFGGLVIVQEPGSAEFDSMPASALATDLADCESRPEEMPRVLEAYVHNAKVDCDIDEGVEREESHHVTQILAVLRSRTGRDFRSYKRGTLIRRIQRRLGLRRIANLEEYSEFLHTTPGEADVLVHDLLIKVTSFFRDPEVWREVEEKVIEPFLSAKGSDYLLRMWVPACSTGEEAYTLAMLVHEACGRLGRPVQMQLFASDIDQSALEVARAGSYSQSIAGDLSPERLAAFFTFENGMYRVRDFLRESIVFAPQNMLTDPPFSKLDFISCRNFLIYLEPDMQRKVIALCHFALNNGGYLLLGSSETVGHQSELFEPVSKILRLFRRAGAHQRAHADFPLRVGATVLAAAQTSRAPQNRYASLSRDYLLRGFAPAAILINGSFRCLYFHGNTHDYVSQPEGEPTRDIFALVRDDLRTTLRGALHQAVTRGEGSATVTGATLRDSRQVPVSMHVFKVDHAGADEPLYLVTFEDAPTASLPVMPHGFPVDPHDTVAAALDRELRATREQLHHTIEQLESSNEELQASHEEAVSMNEELQAANEELETSKEELQSLNEELHTVNAQLREKVEELESLNNDLSNLLASSNVATIFLDTSLCIKRFTPATAQLLTIRNADLGRPIADLNLRIDDLELLPDAHTVLRELAPIAREVRTEDGRWFIRRILPYRTQDNRVEGVVITLLDISGRHAMEEQLRESEGQLRLMADSLPALIAFVDASEHYQFNNAAYTEWFGLSQDQIRGRHMSEVLGPAAYSQIKPYVERVLAGEAVEFERRLDYAGAGEKFVRCAYIPRKNDRGELRGFFVLVTDVSERRRMEEDLRIGENRYRSLIAATTAVVWVADAEGRFAAPQPPWTDYTGQSWEEHRGLGWVNALFPDDRQPFLDAWRVALRDRATFRFDGRIWSAAAQSYRHFNVRAVPIEGNDGELREWIGTIVDIHDRKIHEGTRARLAAIVDDTADAIIGKDLDGIVTSWNAGAERMYGYTSDEMIGQSISVLFPDPLVSDLDAIMRRIRTGERISQMETERRARNGRVIHVSLSISPIRDSSGSIVAASTIARDITERILFERALRESEERLRAALAASRTGTFRWNIQTGDIFWDENMYGLFGLQEPQVLQRMDESLALVHPEDRQFVQTALERSRDEGRDIEVEFRVIWPDGSIHWILNKGKSFLDSEGKPVAMTGACVDITRRKRAEQALEESEARFRGTFEEAAVGIAHVDRSGHWLRMNRRYCDILGYTRRELAKLSFQDISHPDDLDEDWRQFRGLMSGAIASYTIEKRCYRKDGSVVWVQLTASVQRDDEGHPKYAIRVMEDVTARKDAELAMQRINETLERRVAERTQSLLHYQEQLRALAAELTLTAETERRRLARELHDYLAQQLVVCQLRLSQIKRHARSTETESMIRDVDELLAACVRYTRVLIAELSPTILYEAGLVPALRWLSDQMQQQHQLVVTVHAKTDIPMLPEEQAILLFQAVREFLINVVKHAGTQSAWVTADRRDRNVVIAVRDEGLGFDAGAGNLVPDHNGRFGLFSIRERVEAMGGELHVRSMVGEGTECSIWLPLADADSESTTERLDATQPGPVA